MLDTDSLEWKTFRDNASIKYLSKEGIEINLIKLEPNSSFDKHSHEKKNGFLFYKVHIQMKKELTQKGILLLLKKDQSLLQKADLMVVRF